MAGETVSVERWREIERVFDTAADLEQPARRRYLDEACRNDEELRRRVESLLAAAAPVGPALARVVDEDPPHDPRGDGEEVPPVAPLYAADAGQPQVGLVYQAGGVERVPGAFSGEAPAGQVAEVIVDPGHQPPEGVGIAAAHGPQQLRDRRLDSHRLFHSSLTSGIRTAAERPFPQKTRRRVKDP